MSDITIKSISIDRPEDEEFSDNLDVHICTYDADADIYNEWMIQSKQGEYCPDGLSYLDGKVIGQDYYLSEIEEAHYEVAYDAFIEQGSDLYDEMINEILNEKIESISDRYYALFDNSEYVDDVDLHAFNTEQERDDFVDRNDTASALTAEEVINEHEEDLEALEFKSRFVSHSQENKYKDDGMGMSM